MPADRQKIIIVAGLYPGIGKTTLSEILLSTLARTAAVKVTITDARSAVCENDAVLDECGKDSCRLKTSGAEKVIWVQSTEEDLPGLLQNALDRLKEFPQVLIEGNSVLRWLRPDIAVFLCDEKFLLLQSPKPSRLSALARATLIVHAVRDSACAQEATVALEKKIREINAAAQLISLNLLNAQEAIRFFEPVLKKLGFELSQHA